MELAPSMRDHIQKLEEQLLQSEIRRSRPDLEALLADDFTEFATDGAAYGKAQVIDALQREAAYQRSLTDFHIVALAETVVLATYRATRRNEALNEIVESLRSSIWTHRDGRWQLVFHQGTTSVAP
jgi:hypothetical protein